MELADIALIVEQTQDVTDPAEMMIELARFYDVTLNNHIFDCIPYHYYKQRGAGFEGYDRHEKFELGMRRLHPLADGRTYFIEGVGYRISACVDRRRRSGYTGARIKRGEPSAALLV